MRYAVNVRTLAEFALEGGDLAVDSALRQVPRLGFHPCINTMSLAMSGEDFFGKFLPALEIEPTFVDIHDFKHEDEA